MLERRFLVELPLKWYAKAKLMSCNRLDTIQTFLKIKDHENPYIRQTLLTINGCLKAEYSYTTCRRHGHNGSEELDYFISQSTYHDKKRFSDQNRRSLNKARYIIDFNLNTFSLDLYREPLHKLAILEIEFKDEALMNGNITLPPYLNIIREITGDERYSNTMLATLDDSGLNNLLNTITDQGK